MAKSFKLKAGVLQQFLNKLNGMSTEEVGKLKNGEERKANRWLDRIASEMEEANKDYRQLVEKISTEQQKIIELSREEFAAAEKIEDEVEKTAAKKKIEVDGNAKLSEIFARMSKELGLEKLAEAEVETTVEGDDRFDFLKTLWEKQGTKFNMPRKIFIEIDSALFPE